MFTRSGVRYAMRRILQALADGQALTEQEIMLATGLGRCSVKRCLLDQSLFIVTGKPKKFSLRGQGEVHE